MTRRSTGSRREERTKRGGGPMHGWAWRKVINRLKPMDILEPEQLEAIHLASLQLLAEEGMEVLEPNAIEICAKAGAMVDRGTKMVRFDPALIMELVGKAPKSFTVHARNPERSLDYGGKSMVFGTVAGPPFVNDLDRGRRNGNYETLCELIRLQHQIPVIHTNGAGMVEAVDLPVDSRHLDVGYANLTLTDKLWMARGIGEQRIRDSVSMLAIAHGTTVEALKEKPVLLSVISVNSPRRVDPEMIGGLTALVESGQVTIVTPFTLLGAMTPVTLAGGLVQQNAEALFGIAYTQILKPGAPVIYGGFTSNVDMKSGAPAFGTPENVVATIAGGQLARRYGLPFRASNCNAANAVDAQATYESLNMLWACVLGGVNFVHHAAGWMEGGLTVSYEKMILDAELLQNMVEIMKPLEVSPATIALDAMREVGPGGHFFGAAHTLERYETAFYNPILSDWRPFKAWEEAGAETATQRANKIWKQLLADYEKPPIDPGVDEALKDFIARRKREMHGRAAA